MCPLKAKHAVTRLASPYDTLLVDKKPGTLPRQNTVVVSGRLINVVRDLKRTNQIVKFGRS